MNGDQEPASPDTFADIVDAYLKAPKICAARMGWRENRQHKDYVRAQLRVLCPAMPRVRGRVVLLAHKYFFPRKYSFTLLFKSTRIVSLDIGPRRGHRNILNRVSVQSTHWAFFPCDVVLPDERERAHGLWLAEFFERCKIDFRSRYERPVHDVEQPELPLWPKP